MFQLWIASLVLGLISFPVVKNWAVGKIVGLLVVGYGAFVLGTVHMVPIGWGIWGVWGVWGIINFIILKKTKVPRLNLKKVLVAEAVFGILFIFFAFVKGHQGEIYQIERFMDFGFIKALFNTKFLPLEDIWMSGMPTNYYYFGHFLAFSLLKLSFLTPETGFFLMQAWIFAMLGLLAYEFGGIISLFCVVFAGEWQTLISSHFWYPEPTRIISGTITEMPIYTFLVADLHAHAWGLVLGATAIWALFKDRKFLLTFVLGMAIMTNTWDFVTLGSLLFFSRKKYMFFVYPVAIVLALPWLVFYHAPLSGIGIVTSHSPLVPWLLFWAPALTIGIFYLFVKKNNFLSILLFGAIFWIIFLEIFYAKDVLVAGEWFRANTYFKVSLQVWMWLGLASGPIILEILRRKKIIWSLLIGTWLVSRAVYPAKAINQAALEGRSFVGWDHGLDFWKTKFPDDFAAYEFLKDQEPGVILEADGESYADTSFFSVFLGWPTVSGWAVHEMTWRGGYDETGKRVGEVNKVYTGVNLGERREILNKYHVKYIVYGQAERRKYPQVNLVNLGKEIFKSGETRVFVAK